jgi:glycosyltransferase involved in cell wall biosynthesis
MIKKVKSITLSFPTFNEGKNVEKVLEEAIKFLSKSRFEWEILVVDNKSVDNTVDIVKKFMKEYKNIRLILHEKNLGYAASVEDCLKNFNTDLLFVIDSDGQYVISDVDKFIKKINEGYDIVIGWRIKRQDPLMRIIIAKIYNFLFKILFGTSLHDTDCGFRCFTKKSAKKIKIEYYSVPVGPEIVAKAQKYNIKITEVPVLHLKRKSGKSTFVLSKIPFTIIKSFIALIKLKKNLSKIK